MTLITAPETEKSYQMSESGKKFNDSFGKPLKQVQFSNASKKIEKQVEKPLPKTQKASNSPAYVPVKEKEEDTPRLE